MECEEFLEDYSDFLDGTLEDHSLTDYRNHLEECCRCADYDRVMRRGLHLVRALDPPEAAADFIPRLQRRYFVLPVRGAVSGIRNWNVAVAGLAAGLLALVALPLLRPGARSLQLPPVVVETPEEASGSASLWGPPPTFAPTASFLTVPDLSSDPFLATPSRPYSLFRAPLRPRTQRVETQAATPE